ncbi:hypothetical protein Pcinc_039582 [Petrolisthes cinctipes]|uniref:Uncharacterized protein n=1 Tax=Petrolisthes cinctipes TaxID=88211 RepID=A0AAE1EKF9_PETCI|nr:hypothetical protein Pcinc_039582 [Petrolisthes cinctipes]
MLLDVWCMSDGRSTTDLGTKEIEKRERNKKENEIEKRERNKKKEKEIEKKEKEIEKRERNKKENEIEKRE